MATDKYVQLTIAHVKSQLEGESSGHDWWHTYRVWQLAKVMGKQEKANMLVVELAALLHDIADHKFHGGDSSVGPKVAGEWLASIGVDKLIINRVQEVISQVSFIKGRHVKPNTLEGQIVQDADRLDAMGAIGVGRAFAMGAKFNEIFHDPDDKDHKSKTVINHFYQKLLLVKDLLNTKSAKKLAKHRHRFLENFLDEFFAEWDGVR